MATDLVLVPPADRPAAAQRYVVWVLGWRIRQALAPMEAAFRIVVERVATLAETIRGAFAKLIEWDEWRRRKFAPACEHYGARRVSARQYRAYRRMLDRTRRHAGRVR